MFSLVLVDGHGQAILAVLTEYLRLLLLCVFQLPRSLAAPALSVAHSRNLTTPTLSLPCCTCFVCRPLPQPYHTHSFAPLLHLLCLSPTPATLPHPLFRPFATPALSVAHSRNLTTPTLSPLCYTCFVCRPLPQPYHTHSFAPLLHLLCLSPHSPPPPLFLCRPALPHFRCLTVNGQAKKGRKRLTMKWKVGEKVAEQ